MGGACLSWSRRRWRRTGQQGARRAARSRAPGAASGEARREGVAADAAPAIEPRTPGRRAADAAADAGADAAHSAPSAATSPSAPPHRRLAAAPSTPATPLEGARPARSRAGSPTRRRPVHRSQRALAVDKLARAGVTTASGAGRPRRGRCRTTRRSRRPSRAGGDLELALLWTRPSPHTAAVEPDPHTRSPRRNAAPVEARASAPRPTRAAAARLPPPPPRGLGSSKPPLRARLPPRRCRRRSTPPPWAGCLAPRARSRLGQSRREERRRLPPAAAAAAPPP